MEQNENNLKEQQNKNYRLPSKMGMVFRGVIGCYILYLSYKLLGSAANGQGVDKIIFTVCCVAFLIFGAVLLILSVKHLMKGEYDGGISDKAISQREEERRNRITFDEEE